MGERNNLFNIKPGDTLSFGVIKAATGVQFSVYLPDEKNCKLKFYYIGRKEPACVIPLTEEFKRGGVYFVVVTGINSEDKDGRSIMQVLSQDFEYMYEADGKEFIDPYAQVVHGKPSWGKAAGSRQRFVRGGICPGEFDWDGDCQVKRNFNETILYQLHVRGYTKHQSSGVKHKGTYKGLVEKLPYIKELGVNAVLLLPCYEFDEIQKEYKIYNGRPVPADGTEDDGSSSSKYIKLNYWGYGAENTYYLAPKTAYASDRRNPVDEFKNLVKSFHKEGIEVLMDIYFMPGTNLYLMADCLRSWVLNYHVDGFRINNEVMPSVALISDPVLSGVKILSSCWENALLQSPGIRQPGKFLAEYNEGFMNDARRFLKGDEGMTGSFAGRFTRNMAGCSVINFITHINGFTLMDLVSYDVKHNESNGERNRDGTDYNYSWNCGAEGASRKKSVKDLRHKLNWKHNKREMQILEYVRKLVMFRKEHPVLWQEDGLPSSDNKGLGLPGISLHGTQAWRADYSNYNRMLGILLNGDYAKDANGETDDIIYFIFNMYWEQKTFDLPSLPNGRKWYAAITTYDDMFYEMPVKKNSWKKRKKMVKINKDGMELQRKTVVPPRSVVVFIGR